MIDGVQFCWNRMEAIDNERTAERCAVSFSKEDCSFAVRVLNEDFRVSIKEKEICNITSPGSKISYDLKLVVLYYLVNFNGHGLSGELTGYKSLKGGDLFFTGSHGVDEQSVLKIYGKSKEKFEEKCLIIGGKKTKFGDSSFEFRILPKIPVHSVLWLGDDEVGSGFSILFDRSIEDVLPLDMINALINILLKKIVK